MKNKLISSALGVAIVMSGVGFSAQAADYSTAGAVDKWNEMKKKTEDNSAEALKIAKDELKPIIDKKFQDYEQKLGVSEELKKLTLDEIKAKTKPFKEAQENILAKSKELQKETKKLKKEGKTDSPELQKIKAELDSLIKADKDNASTYGPLFIAENAKKQKEDVLARLAKFKTLKEVEQLKADIVGSETIDEHSVAGELAKAKADAKEFLKKHGVTKEQYFDKIDSAENLQEVENWKNEIFKVFGTEDAVMKEFEELNIPNYYVYMKFKSDLEKAADLTQKQQTLKEIKFFLKVAKKEAADNNIEFKDYLAAVAEIWGKTPATPETPSVVEGWVNNGYGWWYQNADGTYPASAWKLINGTWYYFNADGYMLANTVTPDGYFVNADGAYQPTGWVKNSTGWWYQRANGTYPANEWEKVGDDWYHFDANGYMQTGWVELGGTWYYLTESGAMAHDTYVGSYYVDGSGAWVK